MLHALVILNYTCIFVRSFVPSFFNSFSSLRLFVRLFLLSYLHSNRCEGGIITYLLDPDSYANAFILAENMEKGILVNQYEINTKRELKFFWQQRLFDFIPDRKNKTDSSIIIASLVTIIRIITPRKSNNIKWTALIKPYKSFALPVAFVTYTCPFRIILHLRLHSAGVIEWAFPHSQTSPRRSYSRVSLPPGGPTLEWDFPQGKSHSRAISLPGKSRSRAGPPQGKSHSTTSYRVRLPP